MKWTQDPKLAEQVGDVSRPHSLASGLQTILTEHIELTALEFLQFYEAQFSNAGSD